MLDRPYALYVGVAVFGALFVAVGAAGLSALAGADGLGPGFTRLVLGLFLVLGCVAIVVASVDAYRHEPDHEEME